MIHHEKAPTRGSMRGPATHPDDSTGTPPDHVIRQRLRVLSRGQRRILRDVAQRNGGRTWSNQWRLARAVFSGEIVERRRPNGRVAMRVKPDPYGFDLQWKRDLGWTTPGTGNGGPRR